MGLPFSHLPILHPWQASVIPRLPFARLMMAVGELSSQNLVGTSGAMALGHLP